jgi:UPF0755 protein
MPDGQERTAEEREAARRERERRRSGLFNDPDEHLPAVGRRTEPPPAAEDDAPADAAPDDRAGAAADEPGHEPDADEWYEDDDEWFDHPDERPSGTRRVSRLQGDGRKGRGDRGGSPRQSRQTRRPGRPARRAAPAQRPHKHSWLGRMVAVLMVVLAAALVWFAVQLFQPFGTSPHGQVTVTIPAHSGTQQIGDLLAREGVIPSGFIFEVRAALAGDRGKLRSGTYRLQRDMSYGAVLTKLTTPPPAVPTSQLTITEGHSRQYVAQLLHRQGIKGSYLAASRSSPLLNPHAYGAPRHVSSLEGFLFPDTFRLVEPIKVSALVADQLRDFKQRFAAVHLGYARSKNLTPYDVLTIASLIEGEAAKPHDLPLVASVIYNRLRDHMALQLDSTTRYATGNLTGPLTESQLHNRSPYNTRVHTGLPPTPIDSPGMAAIQAAAHPARSPYLYFFTKPCTNQDVFSSSYTRFLNLEAADNRAHC